MSGCALWAVNRGKSWYRAFFDYCFTTMATICCMECVLTIRYIVCAKNVDYNVCLRPTQLIRCLGGTAFVGKIGANRGKLRNFYYGFTTFEKSNRKMSYKL